MGKVYALWSDDEREFLSSDGDICRDLSAMFYLFPEATRYLVAEAVDSENGISSIPASIMRERLPQVFRMVEEKVHKQQGTVPDGIDVVFQRFVDFVSYCADGEEEQGEPMKIYVAS